MSEQSFQKRGVLKDAYVDTDAEETREWIDALEGVFREEGPDRAWHLLSVLSARASHKGVPLPYNTTTPYANTIPAEKSATIPGNSLTARNVAAYVRWNAMAMVSRANRDYPGIGGHIATYASAAVLYETGHNWFFRGPDAENGHDFVYFQGHSSPGMYARAFVEGRLDETHLLQFRRETGGTGLSSYPHPWLMPDFWQFPTVSMGIGPINAIYQARFMKYLQARDLIPMSDRKVWAFLGDGETDEPESTGAISLAARERLDNLIFVINCNLQRLDGPVRGNGKIIQELEGVFRGAGWNVIKVIWGSEWDKIFDRDTEGVLLQKFNAMVDGEFQALRSRDGAWIRTHFFGSDPRLKEMVADISDGDLWQMTRGGHDPRKVYAAYAEAVAHRGQPTVILTKTIKGYGMGSSGESANIAHNVKKMENQSLRAFRDRFHVPLSDDELEQLPFIRPAADSAEAEFLKSCRQRLGGSLPARAPKSEPLDIPGPEVFSSLLDGSGERALSTTMAFVRVVGLLLKHAPISQRIVPIIPDEARTFGMEGLFRQLGIYAPDGQLYTPEDSENFSWYKEDVKGQILEEGITEAGAMSSWMAAATAYANYHMNLIPFYTFYSMFGFQRVGDLIWAAGDMRCRGFLMGATAGRTTLNGEGLQHADGHSLLLAATVPNCVSYDPAFAFELAIIVQDGLERMFKAQQDCFYYITLMNENYVQPPMPPGAEAGVIDGLYLFRQAESDAAVQLMGSGTILNEVIRAAEMLKDDFSISANVWSAPGINQLARDGREWERQRRLHPGADPGVPLIQRIMAGHDGPVIAATDYLSAYPEQLRPWMPGSFVVLGTDGFGRSDTREALRRFFEVDAASIVVTALRAIADDATDAEARDAAVKQVAHAIEKYEIQTDSPARLRV